MLGNGFQMVTCFYEKISLFIGKDSITLAEAIESRTQG